MGLLEVSGTPPGFDSRLRRPEPMFAEATSVLEPETDHGSAAGIETVRTSRPTSLDPGLNDEPGSVRSRPDDSGTNEQQRPVEFWQRVGRRNPPACQRGYRVTLQAAPRRSHRLGAM